MKKTIKYILVIGLSTLLFCEVSGQAQTIKRQTISSCGGSVNAMVGDKSISVQQCIGQSSAIGTFATNNTVLRQGFIQPNDKMKINTKKEVLEFTVYPNPFTSSIRVQLSEEPIHELSITVHDIIGKIVMSETKEPETNLVFDYSELQTGSYIITISNGQISTTKKIIKT